MQGRRETTEGEAEPAGPPLMLRAAPLLVLAAGLVLAYGLGWHRYVTLGWLADQREMLLDMVAHYPLRSGSLFFLVYAAVVALSVPAASVLTIFAGFLFGWLAGGVIVVIAATAGSCLLFAGARTVFGDVLRRRGRTVSQPVFCRLQPQCASAICWFFAWRRSFPSSSSISPPAFFAVSLRTFALATVVGIIPGTFVFTWLGCGFEEAIGDAAGHGRTLHLSDFLTPKLTLAFMALALIAALPLLVQFAREKRQAVGDRDKD